MARSSRARSRSRKRIHIKASRRGSLHRDMGIPQGRKIGRAALAREAKHGSKKDRRKAQFALNMHKG